MTRPPTRARLLSLLSEACELEHALSCSYLYAAFSIKKEISEGLDWRQQQTLRRWAGEIFHVAAEEMLHLAQAWNLLTAVGGAPYYARPNFPQAAKHFPLNVALLLRRFDSATMDRFVYYESPAHERDDLSDLAPPPNALWPIDESFPFGSVGELYGECLRIITDGPADLFVGEADSQVGQDLVDFPDLVKVTDAPSAERAIHLITEQGEGNDTEHEDSHFGVFLDIQTAVAALPASFEVSRPVADNPYIRRRRDQIATATFPALEHGGVSTHEITHPVAILAIDLFDDVYVSMLQAMAYTFSNASYDHATLRTFSQAGLDMMMTVIRPLGEGITLMPSGTPGINAGPTFALSRHATLPMPPDIARRVLFDRMGELHQHAVALSGLDWDAPDLVRPQLASVAHNLGRIAEALRPA